MGLQNQVVALLELLGVSVALRHGVVSVAGVGDHHREGGECLVARAVVPGIGDGAGALLKWSVFALADVPTCHEVGCAYAFRSAPGDCGELVFVSRLRRVVVFYACGHDALRRAVFIAEGMGETESEDVHICVHVPAVPHAVGVVGEASHGWIYGDVDGVIIV